MKLRFLFIAVISLAFSLTSSAQILLQWNTFGNAGTESTEPSILNNNVAATNLTLGIGVTPAANGNRFGGSNWFDTGDTNPTTLAESISGNDYIQFIVTPSSGFSFTPISLVFNWDKSGTGPQNVALRSSADGFAADLGTVVPTAAIGTSNTITISGLSNITVATTFRLYGYGATATGGTGGFDVGSNVVNVQLNGTTASLGKVSNGTGGGDWNVAATWNPTGVPLSTDNVTILTGDVVSTTTSLTRSATTTVSGTFQLNTGGYATGTNFTYGASGTLSFNSTSSYGVANTDVFWPTASGPFNVSVLQGGLTLNTANRTVAGTFSIASSGVTFNTSTLTANGICRIDSGGFFNSNAVVYGASSTLQYNTGGSYSRGFEWINNGVGTIGTTAGYPNNVQLSNNTAFDYNNGGAATKAMNGSLTIGNGSNFNMNIGTSSAFPLIIAGNVTNGGTFTLGNVGGADLKLAGDFTNTGTFAGNGRAVFFTKSSGIQTVTSSAALTIPYVVFDSAGNRTVQLAAGTNFIASAPSAGNAVSFGSASDIFDLNTSTLTIGTTGIANSVSGLGTFKGTASANLSLLGTGSVGTLRFAGGFQNLGTFTINRSAATIACDLGTPVTVNTNLVLTNGLVNLGSSDMTLASSCSNTFTASANSFVISDVDAGTGSLRKGVTANGTYTLPIGDNTAPDGAQYSPATVQFSGSTTFSGASFGVRVKDLIHPNIDSPIDYITRYWDMTAAGISTPTYSFTAAYLPVDIAGTQTNSISARWDGTIWTNGSPIGSNTLVCTGLTSFPATNQFSAGRRNPEINIKQAATDYANGSTFDFGTHVTGSNTSFSFIIQNLGIQSLTLGTPVMTGNPPYSITVSPGVSVSGGATTTFTIQFSPTSAGIFTGSISISNNDPTGSETPYIINFTGIGVLPSPEINIKGFTIGTGNIVSGSGVGAVSGLNNTLYAGINIGSSTAKDFEIQNTAAGTAVLNLTGTPKVSIGGANPGDFVVTTVPASNTIAVSSSTTFVITFSPLASGTRTALVSIANNDTDENPYTYYVQGTGTCGAATNMLTPTSGPVGTEVTITASANNLTGATATFNGVSATVTPVDATHIKVIVPSGAISGNLVTTNSSGCSATNYFTVSQNYVSACQGGNGSSDLFISEVTDSTLGGLSYVEIYNGTGNPVALGNYSLLTYSNGLSTPSSTLNLNNVTLNSGSIYVIALGASSSPSTADTCPAVIGSNGELANQVSFSGGINFDVGNNDYIALYNSATGIKVDSFGAYMSGTWADVLGLGDRGADFARINTAVLPSPTYSNSDWAITNWAGTGLASCGTYNYSTIGNYAFTVSTPPAVTQQPSYMPSCKATSLTVAGSEGFVGGNALAYQWFAVAPGSASWVALTNTAPYSGSTSATLNISNIVGLDGYQYYCQIRENGASCYASTNAVKINEALTVTWNGSVWAPSPPTIGNIAVINGPYDTAVNGSFEACSVTVNGGNTLTIGASDYVNIQNDLTVNATGTVQVLNQGSLVMVDDSGVVTNNGTTQIQKTTSPYNKFDYTYWSSPVSGATIGATFPTWRTDYAFQFVTSNYADVIAPFDGFDDDQNAWVYTPTSTVMAPGKGYAVMAPTTGSFPATSTVTFSGPVNNGVVNMLLSASANGASNTDDFNLIGNPYPSAIFADDFISANTNISGTLYFWTHRTGISSSNPGPDANNFITADYAMYNLSGGTGTGTSSGTGSPVPTGYVASGEGFFVEANAYTNVVFNNSMRNKTYNNTLFYRPSNSHASVAAKNRIWLNLQNADGLFSQQLIGYFDNATLDFDRGYDGIVSQTSNTVSFYSFIGDDKYRIQGRPTFDVNDQVPLGYSSTMAGIFTIAIDNKEGQLDSPDTNIYLEDKLLGIVHDLKQGTYEFTTAIGTFNDRFVLKYINSALGTIDFENLQHSVAVAVSNNQINVKSYTETIKDIAVYDILGRQVFEKQNVDGNEFSINDAVLNQQALIVKVRLESGVVVNRKIIF